MAPGVQAGSGSSPRTRHPLDLVGRPSAGVAVTRGRRVAELGLRAGALLAVLAVVVSTACGLLGSDEVVSAWVVVATAVLDVVPFPHPAAAIPAIAVTATVSNDLEYGRTILRRGSGDSGLPACRGVCSESRTAGTGDPHSGYRTDRYEGRRADR